MLATMSALVGKVEKKKKATWIIQKMISKMDEQSGRMSTTEGRKEGRKDYRMRRNKMKSHIRGQDEISS
jgi:hypothetical protein